MSLKAVTFGLAFLFLFSFVRCDDTGAETAAETAAEEDLGKSREGSRTDDEVIEREEQAIKLDGLSVAQMKELRKSAQKQTFQAEVDRMMKLIINSLYKNKEIFLRELISNASDALDKIRFTSLTDKAALGEVEQLEIKIKADKDMNMLHITDTGIGMTRDELSKNLGTIAKSGTSDFFEKVSQSASEQEASDLIGQFGVGFYSSFLVADKVVVTSKSNDDDQYIWESDAQSFSVVADPRGNSLGRGTTISLHLKEEAREYLEESRIKELVTKYSQFINFPIYLWASKTESVEEPVEEEAEEKDEAADDDEGKVEEDKSDEAKTKTVERTVWDWELLNDQKPIWQRKSSEITDEEYNEFFKSFTKESDDPLAKIHFSAEGEVTFKSVLFIPKRSPHDMFQNYARPRDFIKLYVRRVFITDNFEEMVPKYLSFVRGVVDSDDLPLNVSRETLQQHKLLKVIKKKLVRKVLDMVKKLDKDQMEEFWKEFSTNIKMGVMEDHSNRTRLAKLLRFYSSNSDTELTTLAEYVERMKEKQEYIYYMAGTSRAQVEKSPFVEALLQKGYEVLYLVEAVDEYTMQSLPEFDGKKFQNVAKDGVKLHDSEAATEYKEKLEKEFEPLTKWLFDVVLKDQLERVRVTDRLATAPCTLIAGQYGWSGNMERIMHSQAYAKANDPSNEFYANQKKILEINPRHPLIKELKRRSEANPDDETAKDMAVVMYEMATVQSGYIVKDVNGFAQRVERMLRLSLDVSLDETIDEDPFAGLEESTPDVEETGADDEGDVEEAEEPTPPAQEDHDEL